MRTAAPTPIPPVGLPLALWASTICSAIARSGATMNRYGQQAMEHWRTHRPAAYAQLEDPTAFFTRIGSELEATIERLTDQIAGPDLPGEDYLDKVARLNTARSTATELAKADSEGFWEPELTRQEWEDTTQEHEAGLVEWAFQMKMHLEGLDDPPHETVPETARRYLLDEAFLRQMTEAASVVSFLDQPQNRQTWNRSVEARWQRDSS